MGIQPVSSQFPPALALVATIRVGVNPSGIAFNPRTNTIYVASYGATHLGPGNAGNVYAIDATSYNMLANITVGSDPEGVAVNPTTNLVYVANLPSQPSSISIINGTTNNLSSTLLLGPPGNLGQVYPREIAVNPNTDRIYVTEETRNVVAVINGVTNQIVANVTVGTDPQGIAVLPASNRIFVTNAQSNTMSVIDGNTNTVVTTLPTGAGPTSAAADPLTGDVYVSNWLQPSVSVFNGTSFQLIGTIQTGFTPTGLAVDSVRGLLFIAGWATGTTKGSILVVSTATNGVVEQVAACNPHYIVVNDATGAAYASTYPNTVTVIDNASGALQLTLSASTTTSFVGFAVTAAGNLTGWNTTSKRTGPLQDTTVTIQFALQNGTSSQSVNVQTDSMGKFSAQWIPTITGNYLITAFRPDAPCLTADVSVSVLPVAGQYIFSVSSNSTVAALSFNATSHVLAFQLSAQSAQTARVDVSITKSLLATTASLVVTANSASTQFTTADTGQGWVITFIVHVANTLNVLMDLQNFPSTQQPVYILYILLGGVAAASLIGTFLYRRSSRNRPMRDQDIRT